MFLSIPRLQELVNTFGQHQVRPYVYKAQLALAEAGCYALAVELYENWVKVAK